MPVCFLKTQCEVFDRRCQVAGVRCQVPSVRNDECQVLVAIVAFRNLGILKALGHLLRDSQTDFGGLLGAS